MRARRRLKTLRPAWALAALCCAAIVAAGCGSPGESGGGDSGEIKVGLLTPTSGTAAAGGSDMVKGWNLYFKENGSDAGGRKIVTKHEDTAGDPTVTLSKARKAVQQDNAQVVVGPLLANEAYTMAGFLKQNPDVVGLNPSGSSDDLSQRKSVKNFIRAGGWQSSSPMHPAGEWAAKRGWKRVITLCSDYAFGYENCGGFVNTFTDNGGKVVKQLYAPLGTNDYSSYLAQIKPGSVDGVFVQSVGADAPKFIKAWNDLGLKGKVPLITNETTVEQSTLRGIKGDGPVGMQSFAHYADGRKDKATSDFFKAYKKEYGEAPGYYSCAAYTAAQWLKQAVDELDGDLSDEAKFLKTLREVKLEDSCLGPISLDKYGGAVSNMYLRKVVRDSSGELVNEVEKTYPNVSQFYKYDPAAFLKQPVYSRGYQGEDWPSK